MLANKVMGATSAAPDLNYIEDVFSTYLYTGNGSTQTITNGIDLAGEGGLVWAKSRTSAFSNVLTDTARGAYYGLTSNTTNEQYLNGTDVTAFNSNGFSLGYIVGDINASGSQNVSWTFRKQPKFFDVVTYTGNGVAGRTVAHNLGSVPGCVIIKNTTEGYPWFVYHKGVNGGVNPENYFLTLNETSAQTSSTVAWNSTAPTSTNFTLGGNSGWNGTGSTYVAYLFAHDAGGFGLSGTENVVSCGSFTTDGAGSTTTTLGYEPQFLLYKPSSTTGNWHIADNMRGWANSTAAGSTAILRPNLAGAEVSTNDMYPTATGFTINGIAASQTYIYIAIRRGPMKVPTDGTKVFANSFQNPASAASPPYFISNFPVDLGFRRYRGLDDVGARTFDRLRGNLQLDTASTAAESVYGADHFSYMNGWGGSSFSGASTDVISWNFRRAPIFMDVVCFTDDGTGTQVVNHNLSVVPEMIIVKVRNNVQSWPVYITTGPKSLRLNTTEAAGSASLSPTATTFNAPGYPAGWTVVTYLFATCPGVSKVGSYTGTGTSQVINCGFTSGARFVLIKSTTEARSWCVFDTARGIVSGNDPVLYLQDTGAETTSIDWLAPNSTGFEIVSSQGNVNGAGQTYIFLAVA